MDNFSSKGLVSKNISDELSARDNPYLYLFKSFTFLETFIKSLKLFLDS